MKTTIQIGERTFKRTMQFGNRRKQSIQKSRKAYDRNKDKRNVDII